MGLMASEPKRDDKGIDGARSMMFGGSGTWNIHC